MCIYLYVLYCTVLYCTVLYCTVLYCIVLVCVCSESSSCLRFLDKLYCLSSADALAQFMRNPSSFLLPPYPCVPCKMCVLGPPTLGKTSLATAIAQHYNATVIKLHTIVISGLLIGVSTCKILQQYTVH